MNFTTFHDTQTGTVELELILTPDLVASSREVRRFIAEHGSDWCYRIVQARFDVGWLEGRSGREAISPDEARSIIVAAYVGHMAQHLYVDVSYSETVEKTGSQTVGGPRTTEAVVQNFEDIPAFYRQYEDIIVEFASELVYDNPGGRYS